MQNERIKHKCKWYRKDQTDIKNIDCIIRKISENYPEEVIPKDSSPGTKIDESSPCRSNDTSVDVKVKSERYLYLGTGQVESRKFQNSQRDMKFFS